MNYKIFAKSFAVLLAASLIAYAFNFAGVPGALIDSTWKLAALSIGLSILIAIGYPHLRGVRKGDELSTNGSIASVRGMGINLAVGNFGFADAVALSNGRVGGKIRIRIMDGKSGEARILSYAGTFTPAKVQVTDLERPAPEAYAEVRQV